jgi:hypothetical protein
MKTIFSSEVSRRSFLKTSGGLVAAAAGGGILGGSAPLFAAAADPVSPTPVYAKHKPDVALVFCHIPSGTATWPTKDYDYAARAAELEARLRQACPTVNFFPRVVKSEEEAKALVKDSILMDGYLVYVIGIWTGAPRIILHSGKPVVLVDDLFAGSGEVLIEHGRARREGLPAVTVSSSDLNDVVRAARLFEPIRALKESLILDIVDYDIDETAKSIKDFLGVTVLRMDSKEMAGYYAQADAEEAEQWARFWARNAKKVVEPTAQDLLDSGRMFLALARAAADKKADAVTMDCLGMFYSGRVTAYPCLSHFQMNNDGGTGVCEGDLESTCTQLALRYLTGRPGYVSDPVIDTSKDEIIYAHCVATNRVFGPKGKTNPYLIRSHAEDGKGASVQSLLPVGEAVTSLKFDVRTRKLVVHSAKTVENVDEAKACRTKLGARTEARTILDNWDMGWHRVTVYGDWRRDVLDLGRLLGVSQILEEDRATQNVLYKLT